MTAPAGNTERSRPRLGCYNAVNTSDRFQSTQFIIPYWFRRGPRTTGDEKDAINRRIIDSCGSKVIGKIKSLLYLITYFEKYWSNVIVVTKFSSTASIISIGTFIHFGTSRRIACVTHGGSHRGPNEIISASYNDSHHHHHRSARGFDRLLNCVPRVGSGRWWLHGAWFILSFSYTAQERWKH